MVKKNKQKWKTFFFIASFIIAVALILFFINTQLVLQQITSTEGYIQMQISQITVGDVSSAITLKNECNELTFIVSNQQAQSIQTGATDTFAGRPTTHDIFASVLERYNIKPILVKITKLDQETYFAELTFKKGLQYLTVDIRPSDALALAVRTQTPIYVNNNLVTNVC